MKKKIAKTFSVFVAFFMVCAMMMTGFSFSDFVLNPATFKEVDRGIYKSLAAADTGASSASESQKGGAIYLRPNSKYTMEDGVIAGHSSTYGGAVFVSSGATFTMNGGEIRSNVADYGGAIYIASGGNAVISGGTIINNSADIGSAIYVEEGGSLMITGDALISKDSFQGGLEYRRLGWIRDSHTVYLPTIQFGSYPQDYVGSSMNTILTNWKKSANPSPTKVYNEMSRTAEGTSRAVVRSWNTYSYRGKLYTEVTSDPLPAGSLYRNGDRIVPTGETAWFEVQPITWYILNYDQWKAGNESMELLSEIALTAGRGMTDNYREGADTWLDESFYEQAFSDEEKAQIQYNEEMGHNVYNFALRPQIDWQEHVYITEETEDGESYTSDFYSYTAATCSPSDYAISNSCSFYEGYEHEYRDGVCEFVWVHDPEGVGTNTGMNTMMVMWMGGGLGDFSYGAETGGVRPQLTLNIPFSSGEDDDSEDIAICNYGDIYLLGGAIKGPYKYGINCLGGTTIIEPGVTIESGINIDGGNVEIYVEEAIPENPGAISKIHLNTSGALLFYLISKTAQFSQEYHIIIPENAPAGFVVAQTTGAVKYEEIRQDLLSHIIVDNLPDGLSVAFDATNTNITLQKAVQRVFFLGKDPNTGQDICNNLYTITSYEELNYSGRAEYASYIDIPVGYTYQRTDSNISIYNTQGKLAATAVPKSTATYNRLVYTMHFADYATRLGFPASGTITKDTYLLYMSAFLISASDSNYTTRVLLEGRNAVAYPSHVALKTGAMSTYNFSASTQTITIATLAMGEMNTTINIASQPGYKVSSISPANSGTIESTDTRCTLTLISEEYSVKSSSRQQQVPQSVLRFAEDYPKRREVLYAMCSSFYKLEDYSPFRVSYPL